MYRCSFQHLPGAEQRAKVVLDADDQGLAAGQYAVFYQGGLCLGSAKIQRRLEG
jgi:tRNA-specific 2-thiouridylase